MARRKAEFAPMEEPLRRWGRHPQRREGCKALLLDSGGIRVVTAIVVIISCAGGSSFLLPFLFGGRGDVALLCGEGACRGQRA